LPKAKENGAYRAFWKRRDFFKMKTLLQLLLAQKLISSNCVLFKNNLFQRETVPLTILTIFVPLKPSKL